MPPFFDRARKGMGLPEYLASVADALRYHSRMGPQAKHGLAHHAVVLGDMLREEIHEVHRQLNLASLGRDPDQSALRAFRCLRVWEYVASATPSATIDPVVAFRDLEAMVELLRHVHAEQITPSTKAHQDGTAVRGTAETPGAPPSSPIPKAKPGPKKDMEALERFAKVVAPYGDGWKEHVDQIFAKLDKAKVPAPKRWADHEYENLPIRTWKEGSKFFGRPAVQALEYRYKEARIHFPQIFASLAKPD